LENGFDQGKVERCNSVKELEKRVQMEAGGKKRSYSHYSVRAQGDGNHARGREIFEDVLSGQEVFCNFV